jgi:hypothetical protein
MNECRITVGLEPEPIGEATTSIDAMRKRIHEGSRSSSLIQNCFNQSFYRGLSGEDQYVLLSYNALMLLEVLNRQLLSGTVTESRAPSLQPDFILPEWIECSHKDDADEPLTALEQFILDFEPADRAEPPDGEIDWRVQLKAVIEEQRANRTRS